MTFVLKSPIQLNISTLKNFKLLFAYVLLEI